MANNNTQIAQTILEQMGGTGRLVSMIGAKHFVAVESGVRFRFSNFNGQVPFNFCEVTLRGDDTYDLTISKLRKRNGIEKRTNEHTDSGVYCDQLKTLFEGTTGLALSL
jgi:hypothetical protein